MQGSNLSSNLDAALLETVSYYNDRNLVISSTLLMIKDQRLFRIINWSHRIINWSHRINMIMIQFSFSLSTSVQTSIRIRKLESSSSNPTFWIVQQNLINRSNLNIMDRAHQHQHQIMFNNSSSNNNNSSINSFDLQDAQKEHSRSSF